MRTHAYIGKVKIVKGSRLRYVDDKNLPYYTYKYPVKIPVLGEEYTVRGFTVGTDGKTGVTLEEIKNDRCSHRYLANGDILVVEPGFRATRFEVSPPLLEGLTEKVVNVLHKVLRTKKWNSKEKQKSPVKKQVKNMIISDWLEKYGDPEIDRQVEEEIKYINRKIEDFKNKYGESE